MCGIAAMSLEMPAPTGIDPSIFNRLRQALAGQGDLAGILTGATAELGPGSFPLLESLLQDKELEQDFRAVLQDLEQWLAADRVPEVESAVITGEPSPLVTLRAQVMDLSWSLEKDTLGNLDGVRGLLSKVDATKIPREGLFVAFQLNLVLNALSRLEVRGRDSLGLAVQVVFPDRDNLLALEKAMGAGMTQGISQRGEQSCFLHRTVLRSAPATGPASLVFVWKVAAEVGSLGDNPDFLRQAITGDFNFWNSAAGPGTSIRVLSHTRWASNGVISEANCHPVADLTSVESEVELPGVLAVLNGDVDNYQELKAKYAELGYRIDSQVTTDVQIIPVVVGHHLRQCGDLLTAFRLAMNEMEGSMAVGIISLTSPGPLLMGLSGSGQALFAGAMPGGVAIASEVYGIVETCTSFVRVPGVESGPAANRPGTIMTFQPGKDRPEATCFLDGAPVPSEMLAPFSTEISTRDIDLGDHSHYLIKELSEAERSFRKTIAGKFRRTADGGLTSNLLGTSLPMALGDKLRNKDIRRVFCIGQGTAAVAAEAVAMLLRDRLAPARVHAEAILASELSGFLPDDDLSDCLVVAVSQSGTTTDTNRTVDVARQRGAAILAIVNRRNSDLVYKADGVIYTSDGRDVEMSVASTKAFYSQVAAGQLLSLGLAEILGLVSPADLEREVTALEELPELLRSLFARREEIGKIAEELAPEHRYWATVGNGPGKVAAREIRIKLSELCYKSIPTDITEDKKHIDLSTEPLVILCAAGLEESLLSDVVKEAAIFKAHSATPVVITHLGEDRFDPYAAAVIKVPRARGGLAFVPVTMAGHLWGYYAARAIDKGGQLLRKIRAILVEWLAQTDRDADVARENRLREQLDQLVGNFIDQLLTGRLDGGLESSVGARIAMLLDGVLSGVGGPRSAMHRTAFPMSTMREMLAAALVEVTRGVDALLRPIDAIKHQAKTVTVGISRQAAALAEPFAAVLAEAGISVEQVRRSHRLVLDRLAPLVEKVAGFTLYGISGLSGSGTPVEETAIELLQRSGSSVGLVSRATTGSPLKGSKWLVVKRGNMYFGRGRSDDRPILILPLYEEGRCRRLLLLHVDCLASPALTDLVAALDAFHHRLDEIRAEVTERNLPWQEDILASARLPEVFSMRIRTLVDELVQGGA